MGQSRVADSLARSDSQDLGSGAAGALALWFIVAGLGLVGLSVLLA